MWRRRRRRREEKECEERVEDDRIKLLSLTALLFLYY
jgi:hypothetical protein